MVIRMKQWKHKVISILVAIVLIIIIALIAFGGKIKESMNNGEEIGIHWLLALLYPDKYSYSVETADLNEYYQLFSEDDIAIILQDERIESSGKLLDGTVYFSISTISDLFTDRFYVNDEEGILLYTTSTDIYKVNIGENSFEYAGSSTPVDYQIARYYNDGTLYIAADYVQKFADFSYEFFPEPNRMQVYTQWGTRREAEILKDTQVRYQGGIKSAILRQIAAGEKVTVLEVMETWTKVKTADGYIGYVENDKLADYVEVADTPTTGAYQPENDYQQAVSGNDIQIGFHQVYSEDDGTGLTSLLPGTTGMDVVSPTWFYLDGAEGTFTSLANANYVETAHANGLQVWALMEDMTNDFDEYALFASSISRKTLIDNLISQANTYGFDGINIDCEEIDSKTAPHFVQFLRELSIATRNNGLVLSIDNYVPNEGNRYYNLKEQGYVADYVIMMGYDEHWAGSEAGSTASLDFVEKGISDMLTLGVPQNKLICAVPFYTRIWRTEGAETSSEAVGMETAAAWVADRNLTPVWDDTLCQYYIDFQDGTAYYQVWLEDDESMTTKLAVIQQYDLAGVAAWKLGLEDDTAWNIINAYSN